MVDYFVVAGLPKEKQIADEFSRDSTNLKSSHSQAPITDITVIFPALGECVPEGYTVIKYTPTGETPTINYSSPY